MNGESIYAQRSQRTVEAYLNVYKPLIWNVPLVIIFFVSAITTRPSFSDTIPVLVLATCFVVMCIPTGVAVSRLPALKRSEENDKKNLKKGLRPNGDNSIH